MMSITFFKKLLSHKRESPIIGANRPALKASAEYGGMGERELQLRLELILDKMASGDPAIYATARGLTAYSLSEQERFLRAVQGWKRQSPEFACQFCHHGLSAFKRLKGKAWDDWLLWLSRALRREGLAASGKIRQLDSYLSERQPSPQSAALEELMPVLRGLLTALGGRRLQIKEGDVIHTDTSTIYLPARCERFSSYEENRGFYKLALVFAWAQTCFSSWQADLQVLLYDLNERQLRLFQALEGVRLEACIERNLPGIARLMQALGRQRDRLPAQQAWQKAAQQLQRPEATVQDSIAWINKLPAVKRLSLPVYQGRFQPLAVRQALNTRVEKEEKELQTTLRGIAKQRGKGGPGQTPDQVKRFSINTDQAKPRGARQMEFTMDGEPVELTPQLERLLHSISQDWNEIPPQWLRVDMDKSPPDSAERKKEQAAAKTSPETESQVYVPEWDHSINDYRPNWCRVFLNKAEAGDTESGRQFSQAVKSRHYGLISRLRNSFEFLRAADMRMRRQTDGDEIDIDALVDSLIAARRGEEPDAEIYTQNRKMGRNVAVVFMVDMSGSTRGRVNRLARESLILLCEALSSLRDRYALYGFSSHSRSQCMIYRIKSFDEEYNHVIESRIANIQPHHYTRMGAAIRYLRSYLLNSEAKTRLLLSLSDGRPEDKDGYRGKYGIEDTRRALMETAYLGIHNHCITIDSKAMDYLPRMYGHSHVSIVNDIETLPFRMADIYRRITQ